jgi:glycosyltransferase involved in cell wall biosynthesis
MQIGFDGKRAYQNNTGLGNYSRALVSALANYYPDNQYTLFAPRITNLFNTGQPPAIHTVTPGTTFYKKLPALWRRSGMVKDIANNGIDVFHGLSNELPAGISLAKVKSVVTVHDLIFEKYPATYHWDERYTHRWKMKRACREADAIIATSQQTKNDLVQLYRVPQNKITVCYQNCHPHFETLLSNDTLQLIKKKYNLPAQFFLFVSSITPRKNLITACKALLLLKQQLQIPLVVIGSGGKEKQKVKAFLQQNGLLKQVLFLNESEAGKSGYNNSADLPGIYQQALALIYPSFYEGFGIPLLEALWSRVPVISSNSSSLPEVAGEAGLYFAPYDATTLAAHMQLIATNTTQADKLKEYGLKRAELFTAKAHCTSVMQVYKSLSH